MSNAFLKAAQPNGTFLKFKDAGTEHTIQVESVTERQATEYGTNAPKTFPSGDPIMEQWISGQVWDEEKEDLVDATLVVSSPRMRRAIGRALIAEGASEPQAGGVLTVKFTGFGTGKNPANPPKEYDAAYQAPEPVGNPWGDVEA